MATFIQPWQILVAALAGWITRQQDAVIEYLQEDNRVLKQQLGRKRLRLTDDQRRRLAVRGKAIGRRALAEVASHVTPGTTLRWHRQLIAKKWTHKRRSPGRPRIEVWAPRGPVTFYVFFVIELATRRIEIAGITPSQNEAWMMQIGRNLTDPFDGSLAKKRLLILDRDTKFSPAFRDLLKDAGGKAVRLPYRSPNLNAYAERFVRSIKEECLGRMTFFGERSLQKATREYAAHYHRERNHQGIDNRLIAPDNRSRSESSAIECAQRLGGMLPFYHRADA